jgi:hypothetical protein
MLMGSSSQPPESLASLSGRGEGDDEVAVSGPSSLTKLGPDFGRPPKNSTKLLAGDFKLYLNSMDCEAFVLSWQKSGNHHLHETISTSGKRARYPQDNNIEMHK